MGRIRKTLVLLLLVLGGYLYVEHVNPGIVADLFTWFHAQHPEAAKLVDAGIVHARNGSLVGVALVMFLSRLPFNPVPPEPYILYAYTGSNVVPVAFAAALFGTAGSIITYTIGRVLGHHAFKESRIAHWIESVQYSSLLPVFVFLSTALPIPDVTSLLFGTVKTPFKTFVLYSFLGFLAWTVLTVLAAQHVQDLMPWLNTAFVNGSVF